MTQTGNHNSLDSVPYREAFPERKDEDLPGGLPVRIETQPEQRVNGYFDGLLRSPAARFRLMSIRILSFSGAGFTFPVWIKN